MQKLKSKYFPVTMSFLPILAVYLLMRNKANAWTGSAPQMLIRHTTPGSAGKDEAEDAVAGDSESCLLSARRAFLILSSVSRWKSCLIHGRSISGSTGKASAGQASCACLMIQGKERLGDRLHNGKKVPLLPAHRVALDQR